MRIHFVSAPAVCWCGWCQAIVVPQLGLVVEWV
jgi:hypothetical protein